MSAFASSIDRPNVLRRLAGGGLIVGFTLLMASSYATALPVGANDGGTTMKDLKGKGYSCEVVATGFYECTKSGSTTYWCDGTGACQPKPRIQPNPGKIRHVPNGGVFQR